MSETFRCADSQSPRGIASHSGEEALFFKPVHFDLELADLLIKPRSKLFFGPVFSSRRSGKQRGHFIGRLLFPSDDLIGVDPVQRSELIQGLLALDRSEVILSLKSEHGGQAYHALNFPYRFSVI